MTARPSAPSHPSRLLALPVAVALACAGAAHAQETAPAAPATLGTITVTAERQEANIKDVPISITTLSDEKLDVLNSSGQDVRFLSGRVPSLNVESSFGRAFPRFYIRGYGNSDFHLNASQPVSLVYDDVVQESPILKGFPVFDLDRIEVLRGPQGTLFGRNTPAGVVKFESVKPEIGKTGGYGSVSYGTYNTVNVEGAIAVPINDEWAARVSAQEQRRSGWVSNSFSGESKNLEGYRDQAARAQLLYKPNAVFSALFSAHGRDLNGTARLFRANIIRKGTNDFAPGFNPGSVSIDGQNVQWLQNYGASARLRWDIGDYVLHSITGYETVHTFSRGDVDGGFGAAFAPPSGPGLIPFPSETADGLSDHKQITQEFRIESKYAGPLNWQAGLYYFHEDYDIDSYGYDSLGGGVETSHQLVNQKNDAWAAFGSVRYDVTEAFNVRAGLRYTEDKKKLALRSYTTTGTPLFTPSATTADPSDSKVNWDLTASYKLTADTNVYARVATGFRGSSIQPVGQFGPQSVARPETSLSYELGVKTDLFDKRARLSADVFHYQVKDQQLSAVGGGANVTTLLNAKKSVGEGVEVDLDAYLTDNLLATLGGSYNFTKIKDGSLTVGGCGLGGTVCTMLDPQTAAGTYSIDGNPLPQAPRWVANATLRYGFPLADGSEVFVYTDWAYRSSVNFFLYEATEFKGKSLLEGGLRTGYVFGNGKYEAAAFARNITGTKRVVGAIDFNNLTGFINEPRIIGLQLKAKF